jgi:hypothetical protein
MGMAQKNGEVDDGGWSGESIAVGRAGAQYRDRKK